MGHLGSRVSALLDGQLSAEETERAWAHVQSCHSCRDQVEREGWLKRRLAGLAFDVAAPSAPADLKGSLLGVGPGGPGHRPTAYSFDLAHPRARTAGLTGMAVLGGGAIGAAVVGAIVLGGAPADAPGLDRTPPVTSISRTPATPAHTTLRSPSASASPQETHRHAARAGALHRMPAAVPDLDGTTIPVALRAPISPDAPR
jgi:anti-sigma factor RsiW